MKRSAGQMLSNVIPLCLRLSLSLATVLAAVVPDRSESFAEFDPPDSLMGNENLCRRAGDRYIQNYIQYECFTSASADSTISFDSSAGRSQLVGKPIGCKNSQTFQADVYYFGLNVLTLNYFGFFSNSSKNSRLCADECDDRSGNSARCHVHRPTLPL